jgi:hypothetical protein
VDLVDLAVDLDDDEETAIKLIKLGLDNVFAMPERRLLSRDVVAFSDFVFVGLPPTTGVLVETLPASNPKIELVDPVLTIPLMDFARSTPRRGALDDEETAIKLGLEDVLVMPERRLFTSEPFIDRVFAGVRRVGISPGTTANTVVAADTLGAEAAEDVALVRVTRPKSSSTLVVLPSLPYSA